MSNFAKNIKQLVLHPLSQNIFFWLVAYYILLNLFSNSTQIAWVDYFYTILFTVTLIAAVYANGYVIEYYLKKDKYWQYLPITLGTILVFSYINLVFFNYIVDYLFPSYYFISYFNYWDIIKFFSAFIGITTLIKWSKNWFKLIKERKNMEELEKAKSKAELDALINQVNPHFLFNSLNVLYSLSLTESKQTPEVILKLSEVLRYALYQTNQKTVPLASEIKLLKDYQYLQTYRSKVMMDFTIAVDNDQAEIAPMLLLPLLENAFKHGNSDADSVIKVSVSELDGTIQFSISNAYRDKDESNPDTIGGIGIENIKERLRLTFPDRHSLVIDSKNYNFNVTLSIWPQP